jgi:predicted PurR-regulated permease PerM
VLIGPAVFVAQQIATEGAAAIEQVEKGVARGRSKQAIEKNPRLESSLAWVAEKANLAQEVKQASQSLSEKLGSIVAGTVAIATGILITLFLLFYFFRDGQELIKSLRGLVPLSERESTEVFHRVGDTIGGIVYGTLIVALIQGALGGLMFWWLGLPGPILWGAVMAVLAVLPLFGAAIVWVPAALFLALEGDWTKALILTGWGSIVVALIDNLLYPLLVKDRLQLHTVPVFISIVGGLAFFGAAGIVLGPVVLAVAVVLLDIWRRRIAHRGAAENVVEAGVRTRS